jgi:hypothetical protein
VSAAPKDTLPPKIRDRVIRFDRVRAGDILPDPRNPKTHPQEQLDAISHQIGRLGFAGTGVVRQLPDGRLMFCDGHGRSEIDPDFKMPVVVTDLNEQEAGEFLYTYDALAQLAKPDMAKLNALLEDVPPPPDFSPALTKLLDRMRGAHEAPDPTSQMTGLRYQLIVECPNEKKQAELMQRLESEGFACKMLIS